LLTFEDMTGLFLKAARDLGLVAHPEFWINTRSLEREFDCTCHSGSCDDTDGHSSCVVSLSWGALDTALSIEGPAGVCEFFHDTDESCSHLRTNAVPPLVVDLSYTLELNGIVPSEEVLLSLVQLLRLRASESSRRTIETSPGVSMVLRENRLYPDVLTLQQRVEIPIWHPLGMRGLHEETIEDGYQSGRSEETGAPSEPRPEEWLPQTMVEVCQDVIQVLPALDATITYNSSDY